MGTAPYVKVIGGIAEAAIAGPRRCGAAEQQHHDGVEHVAPPFIDIDIVSYRMPGVKPDLAAVAALMLSVRQCRS